MLLRGFPLRFPLEYFLLLFPVFGICICGDLLRLRRDHFLSGSVVLNDQQALGLLTFGFGLRSPVSRVGLGDVAPSGGLPRGVRHAVLDRVNNDLLLSLGCPNAASKFSGSLVKQVFKVRPFGVADTLTHGPERHHVLTLVVVECAELVLVHADLHAEVGHAALRVVLFGLDVLEGLPTGVLFALFAHLGPSVGVSRCLGLLLLWPSSVLLLRNLDEVLSRLSSRTLFLVRVVEFVRLAGRRFLVVPSSFACALAAGLHSQVLYSAF